MTQENSPRHRDQRGALLIPDHELIRCIGRGSFGEVWLAKNVFGNHRAIKIVERKRFRTERAFEKEFAGLQRFEPISREHDGFVDILHVGRNDESGYFYYVMELADDDSGGDRLDSQTYTPKTLGSESAPCERLSVKEVLRLGLSLTEALAQLHRHGLVHRDIKPSNIVFVKGVPKLADIGLVAQSGQRTFVGTEGFIPPEGPGTAQADLFSLGKVLYEVSTGKDRLEYPELPADVDSMAEREAFLRLSAVILKACNDESRQRYQTASEMNDDLTRLEQGKAARIKQNAPHNLPAQLTSFVGRGKEMEEIEQLLSKSRLVTLTGIGGCGKTRLALQVGERLLGEFPSGVWLVELGSITDPELVPEAIIAVLHIQSERTGSPLATLTEHLRDKQLLLLLDNCEHLIERCASLADTILKACPQVQILATSREPLGITGELRCGVPSLSVADPVRLPSVERVAEYEAERLFVERAQTAQADFALTKENAAVVAQICWRLDGIPLALELAAARVRAMSVEQIAQRLDDRFRLLTGGSRTAVARQQTLQATIDWSYDLLSEPERALFWRLAVFAGGWSLEAAEAVCAGEGIETAEILNLLTRLMDKSLVTGETHGRAKRYRMLETVRQYGWDRLNESGKRSVACNQHLNFFLALAQQAEPRLIGSAQEAALDELEAEHANLLAALAWAAETEPVAALKLSNALGWFWEKRGSLAEGREWFRRTIARCPAAPADLCGEAHVRSGRIACWQGDYQQAVALTEQGLQLCEQSGNRRWAGMALNNLGGVAAYCGELTRAESLLERSLSIGKDLADNDIIWRSLGDLGVVAMFQGNYERARDLVEQTIVIGRLGDEDGGIMLHVLGDIECALGNIEKAASCYEKTLALGRKLGHKRAIAGALEGLGKVASDRGDYVHARKFYHEGLRVANEIGEKSEYAITIGINLAELAAEEQKSDEARSHSTTSLRSSRQVGDKESIASALSILGWLCFASDGQAEEATQLLGAAETARQSTGIALSPRQRARHERRLAVLRAALGQEGFAAAWARGKAMTLDQAIACVL